MKKQLSKFIAFSLILNQISCFIKTPAYANLSKDNQEKLNELTKSSRPSGPIFGKVNEPIKAGVSIYRYTPEKIYLNELKPEEAETQNLQENIALLPADRKRNISDLEQKRADLQKSEVEGLNFIQPSIALTKEEQDSIDEFFTRNEQEQLLNLWKATMERNKTIQYIIQKLSPANSPQEKKSILSKTIGAAIFLPFYAVQAFTNNAGAQYSSQVGSRVLGSVLQGKMGKNESLMQLSQTEAIVLFMMVDEVAERLRQRYYNYKRLMIERALASNELEETKNDGLIALEYESSGAGILTNIQRRALEREIRRLDTEVRYHKNSLIELAGLEAITQLDNQLKLEIAATKNAPLDLGELINKG